MTPLSITAAILAIITPDFTAPAEMTSFDRAALHEPAPIKLKSEEGQRRLEGVAAVLQSELSALDRRRLGRKVLSERRVTISPGQFPGADTLVAVNVNLRNKDPEAPQQYISGVFTMTAAGELGSIIAPIKMRPERYELGAIGDVDGDGAADVVFTVSTETTSQMHLVSWSAGAPVDHTVSAPGADE